jgi:hypothetical protein
VLGALPPTRTRLLVCMQLRSSRYGVSAYVIRPFEIQSCCCYGSAFEVAAFQTRTASDDVIVERAGVWPPDEYLKTVAREFNLSETAFVVRNQPPPCAKTTQLVCIFV